MLAVTLLTLALVAVGAVWRLVADDGVVSDPGDGAVAATGDLTPVAASPSPTPTPPPDVRFTIAAAGDVLPHSSVITSARTETGHDFGPLMAPMTPWVAGADLALCHLEVPLVPAGERTSGYPMFASPAALATGLAQEGWDGCSTASNHSLDRRMSGVVSTLDAMDAAGLGHVGTARTATEAAAPQLYQLEREGQTITLAHLAATYGLNGLTLPDDAPWAATMLDAADLVRRATEARTAGADVVVVSSHCCTEYVTAPDPRQVDLARRLADSGVVDVIFGHHAHVPQPVEQLPGGPADAGMWVFHGLGNMLSNQDAACCVSATSSGVLATVEVTKPADGPARVTDAAWTGTTVDRGAGHRVHALPDVVGGTGTLGADKIAARADRVAEAVGPAAPHRTSPPEPTGALPVVVPRPR